jgi:hypothetical protein
MVFVILIPPETEEEWHLATLVLGHKNRHAREDAE